MQIRKARHLKICEDFGKMKIQDSRALKIRYTWRNCDLKFQDISYGIKHPKKTKNRRSEAQKTLTCA